MVPSQDRRDFIIRRAASRLTGHQRRLFLAEAALELCEGNPRAAEERYGWGRHTVEKGIQELQTEIRCLENFAAKGRTRWEVKHPQLAADIRVLAEPKTQADPELKSSRCYTNLSAQEVRDALLAQGYADKALPKVRTLRNILNRMGYRLQRIQKAKPLKKTKDTDAIFANVHAAREQYQGDAETLEISMDTKAKVAEGDYARGGKKPNRRSR